MNQMITTYTTTSVQHHDITLIGIGGAGKHLSELYSKENEKDIICHAIDLEDTQNSSYPEDLESRLSNVQDFLMQRTEEISQLLDGTRMVVIGAGLGGATGTIGALQIGRIAKKMGIPVHGFFIKPFAFEGVIRQELSNLFMNEASVDWDSLTVLSNDDMRNWASQQSESSFSVLFDQMDRYWMDKISSFIHNQS